MQKPPDQMTLAEATTPRGVDEILHRALAEMHKAIMRFPQSNYVALKVAEEAGEVIKAAVHYAEGRETWEKVEGEAVQAIAMILRLLVEGDRKNGIVPPTSEGRPSDNLPRGPIEEIAAERRRQVDVEGWTTGHDDAHDSGELAKAAGCYAWAAAQSDVLRQAFRSPPPTWPTGWSDAWWKLKDRRADLVRAGALIVAEIERLDRLNSQSTNNKQRKGEA